MNYQTIKLNETFNGQVAELVLSSPPANILTAAMMSEILDFLESDLANTHRKLIVIRGEGDHFCFGASVEEHTADQVRDMLPGFHRLIGAIINHPVATLAQVSGFSLGGGFELALACSYIFADKKAKFAVPEIQLGVFPPVAAALLPAISGVAMKMILTGNRVSADELHSSGVVTEVSEENALSEMTHAFIEKNIIVKSASSLRIAHQATRLFIQRHYKSVIDDLESLYLDHLMTTHDANEGINSFLEKRTPVWKDA